VSDFTVNYSPNPSQQLGLTGYGSFDNATLALDTTRPLFYIQSMMVNTPGMVPGEGCSTPNCFNPANQPLSFSLYILGSGSFTVEAVVNNVIAASVPFMAVNQWTRVVINDVPALINQQAYISVTTTSAQATTFWVTGVQVEPESPAHSYCDGSQPGCFWTGGITGSTSFQPYMNPVQSLVSESQSVNLVPVLETGEQFFISGTSSETEIPDVVPSSDITIAGPAGAVTDFAVSLSSDPDPAQTYVSYNTASGTAATSGPGNRIFGIFYPPADYFDSSGQLWDRAAYMAAGYVLTSMPANATVKMGDMQVEILPVGDNAPSAWDTPRAIHTIVKPSRLNYCQNPSFEVSTASWSAVGTAVLSQDTSLSAGNITEYDDVEDTAGTCSLQVRVNAGGDGAEIMLTDLIAGDEYIASAYVQAGAGIANISITCGGETGSVLSGSGTGYGGPPGYGSGYYGGIPAGSDLATGQWYRIYVIFTAPDEQVPMLITSTAGSDFSSPSDIWADAVLVETGQDLQSYFDGNFGSDYSWETGGAPGLARSYYYDQQAVKSQAVNVILAQHLPLGISAAAPLYSVPYTQ
jgi:hypothetical protein